MSDSFYRAFEDRYRGGREVIKSRLRAYVPFIEPLVSLYPPPRAIDLGCGRGEWIELLGESGYVAEGVDIDETMLAACTERGLPARREDALAALRQLPADSIALVSALHVVEHMAFDDVRALTTEALRVLKPGGLLILETPNPENLVVGATNFYIDPTHLRPIPSELLSFVVEYTGFERHKIVRLNESPSVHAGGRVGLVQALSGVGPDYGVIGQKAAPPQVLASFNEAFASHHGIGFGTLVLSFDQQVEDRFGQSEDRASRTELHLAQAEKDLRQAQEHVADVEASLRRAQEQTAQIDARLNQVMSAYSWRILSRLDRGAHRLVAAVRERRLINRLRRAAFAVFPACARQLNAHPRLRGFFVAFTRKVGLYDALATLLRRSAAALAAKPPRDLSSEELNREMRQSPPAVRQMYAALDAEINKWGKR
jgi:SAM-dependent methyltransferase